jgi:hypothetical protein
MLPLKLGFVGKTVIGLIAALLLCSTTPWFAYAQEDNQGEPETEDQLAELWKQTDQAPDRLRVRASTVVAASYMIPTATDENDPRTARDDSPELSLRNAYVWFAADLGHKSHVYLNLAGRRIRELDIDDDGTNDDPNAGRLAITMRRAVLSVAAHPAAQIEAGVIRLPWSSFSEEVWGFDSVADSASRRYGMVEDSDLGVSVRGLFPGRFGAYQWAFYNGERRIQPETSPHKATALRLSFAPFIRTSHSALRTIALSGFGEYRAVDNPPGDEIDNRVSWASMITWSLAPVGLGIEWFATHRYYDEGKAPRPSAVASVFASVDPTWWVSWFGRVDFRDPDLRQDPGIDSSRKSFIVDRTLDSDEDGRMYLLTGASFRIDGSIRLAPWIEAVFYQERSNSKPLPPTVALNTSLYLRF